MMLPHDLGLHRFDAAGTLAGGSARLQVIEIGAADVAVGQAIHELANAAGHDRVISGRP